MAHEFKIGDRVRLKGDHHYGTITYVNGPGEFFTISYILGVEYSAQVHEIESERERLIYQVWRQDDHGNKVMIHKGLTEFEATTIKDILERRGHKQMYWVDNINPFSMEKLK